MKNFLVALVLSVIIIYFESAAFAQSGFKKINDDAKSYQYTFRENASFIISKNGLSTKQAAIGFCSQYAGSHLAHGDEILLIAMSGAANLDETLKKSISLTINDDLHGIIGWISTQELETAEEGKDIFLMVDGHGTDTETENLAEMNKIWLKNGIQQAITVHAICVKGNL